MNSRQAVGVAVLTAGFSGCALFCPSLEVGQPIPRWSYPATDGGDTVRSTNLGGRPGLLVWIDPLCPQVEHASQSGGPLRTLESRWNATDSAWVYYVAARTYPDAVLKPSMWRPWLKEMKLRGSVILDTSMSLARTLGVHSVPYAVVVGPDGDLRWKGPVQSEEEGQIPGASMVLDSVLANRPLPALSLKDTGCSIKDRLW